MLTGMKYDNPASSLKTETISVAVPLDLKQQIRRAADRNRETAADFVRKAVSDRLARAATPPRSRGGR
jgi:Arc/MetJ-type ribon-helix-helix transcriptional regulator